MKEGGVIGSEPFAIPCKGAPGGARGPDRHRPPARSAGAALGPLARPRPSGQNRAAISARRRCALSRAARIGSAGPVVGPIGTKRTSLTPMNRSASRR